MWSAHLPPENNPILEEHLIYAVLIPALTISEIAETWGLGAWWSKRIGKVA